MNQAIRYAAHGITLGALLGVAPVVFADQTPDNTGRNQPNRQAGEPTAEPPPSDRSDLELTRQIRRSLMQDKSLSTYGHNIKIIAQGGSITLKGAVRSMEEKELIERKAAEVAGAANVKSQLEVIAKK